MFSSGKATASICGSCGYLKRAAESACAWCGVQPVGADELAKARLLSQEYRVGRRRRRRAPAELDAIAAQVAAGSYRFDEAELAAVRKELATPFTRRFRVAVAMTVAIVGCAGIAVYALRITSRPAPPAAAANSVVRVPAADLPTAHAPAARADTAPATVPVVVDPTAEIAPVTAADLAQPESGVPLRKEIYEALTGSQRAYVAGDYNSAADLARSGLRNSRTTSERELALKLLLTASMARHDGAGAPDRVLAAQGLASRPGAPDRLTTLAYSLLNQDAMAARDYAAAVKYGEAWAALGDGRAANVSLAVAYFNLGDCRRALESVAITFGPEPREEAPLRLRARCLARMGDRDASLRILEDLATRFPTRRNQLALAEAHDSLANPRRLNPENY